MKPKSENAGKPTFSDEKYEKMYQEAISRPGIREVVQVNNSWSKKSPKNKLAGLGSNRLDSN